MGIKAFNVMDLGKAVIIKPEQLGYRDSLDIIKDESFKIQKSFVKIGWYLKHIRDNELYKEDGYANIWECAADQLGYSQSTASRFINICEKFSKDHNSPELDSKYAGFDKSQMIEMLPMEPEQLEKITPDMTVKQIRDIKLGNKGEKEEQDTDIPGQTSIEADFPEYMPEAEEQDTKEMKSDSYATSHNVNELYSPIDGEYREIEEPEPEEEKDEADKEMGKKLKTPAQFLLDEFANIGAEATLDVPKSEPEETTQPEFPVLKNNDQRKKWLADYKAWGLWYRDENIDVNYYKYDFEDGSRLVVAEYPQRYGYWNDKRSDEYYFHLLEKNKKSYKKTYDEQYRNSTDSETYLIEFLKSYQKGMDTRA